MPNVNLLALSDAGSLGLGITEIYARLNVLGRLLEIMSACSKRWIAETYSVEDEAPCPRYEQHSRLPFSKE